MLTSIAILGKPNVGKSTLFNKLTKSRGAIVSNFSGLTKDRNYGIVNLNNKNFLLIDTGGIESEVKNDEINSKISDQAWIAAEEANSVILLLDKTQNLSTSEEAIIKKLRKLNKTFLVVINKNDIKRSGQIEEDITRKGIKEYISISAEHSIGLQQLKKYLDDLNPINSNYQNEETIQKISIIGRPNAGKSTLINKVSDTQRVIVSSIPGTTIDALSVPITINKKKYVITDTAGIRKGYRNKSQIEYFSFVKAMHAVDNSDLSIILVDANQGIVDQDLKILNMAKKFKKPIIFALNKIDLLSKSDLNNLQSSRNAQKKVFKEHDIFKISAKDGTGVKKMLSATVKIMFKARKKFSTAKLNKVLTKITEKKPPPSVKGRILKLKYINFAGVNPIRLVIHASQDKKIPANYKKYLLNQLKDELDLKNIPLELIFRKADNPYKKINKLSQRQIKKRKRLISFTKKRKK